MRWIIALCLLLHPLLAAAQEEEQTVQVEVRCFSTETAVPALAKLDGKPGLVLIEIEGDQLKRFFAFLEDSGADLDTRGIIKAILIEVSANAGAGPARTQWIFIRDGEPAYCGSKAFAMPPEVGRAALRAIFGQNT